jgi:hypothetical protein
MDSVDSAQRKSTQIYNPLQTESDAVTHLRLCEDAIAAALLDIQRCGRVSTDTERTLRTLSNTRVTPGPKIQDSCAPPGLI